MNPEQTQALLILGTALLLGLTLSSILALWTHPSP